MENKTTIFSDGASKGNPGPGGYGAIVVSGEKVREFGGREELTTNNRMELSGALAALASLPSSDDQPIDFYTDSKYVINGMTGWIYGWQKNGWQTKEKKEVLNRDLWEKLADLARGRTIKWNYVGGHIGVPGNERCDEIADALATGKRAALYDGALADYKIDIHNLGHDAEKKENKSRSGAKAYSYVSLVDGKINIDQTWAECEKRVKGAKGAKFKKALSAEEERALLEDWGGND